jgi:beta-glucosidase
MSLSWSRLQPHGQGLLNPTAVGHYRSVLGRLRDKGVRTFVTLYHWDLPQDLEDAGGWPARVVAERFAAFAAAVAVELGDLADDWITVNEPWCSAFLGYGSGKHAPGRTSLSDAVAAAHHLNVASGLAIAAFRSERPLARLGPSHIITDLAPATGRTEDLAATLRLDANNNQVFLTPLLEGSYSEDVLDLYARHGLESAIVDGDEAIMATRADFLGINHYHRLTVRDDPSEALSQATTRAAEPAATHLGWSITPDSLTSVLRRVARMAPGLPLYVTENGASFCDYVNPDGRVDDRERVAYMDGYLNAAADAIESGVRLEGYFAWSLMDNFEWGEGFRQRFGLYYVDYRTQDRIAKTSAYWYRNLIELHARVTGEGDPRMEVAKSHPSAPNRVEGRPTLPA